MALHGYSKGDNSSKRHQQKQIDLAEKRLARGKEQQAEALKAAKRHRKPCLRDEFCLSCRDSVSANPEASPGEEDVVAVDMRHAEGRDGFATRRHSPSLSAGRPSERGRPTLR